MSKPRKHAAFVAYLLPVLGWLYVFLFYRDNELAMFHAKQAIVLTILVIAAPVVWFGFSWLMLWIPTFGALISAASFTVVMLVASVAAVLWIVGMVYSAQAREEPLPIVGRWTARYL